MPTRNGTADSALAHRGRGAVKRLRNAMAEALPVLGMLADAENVPDRIGQYVVEAGEELDTEEIVDFLEAARAQHAGRLRIIVLGPPGLSREDVEYGPAPSTQADRP